MKGETTMSKIYTSEVKQTGIYVSQYGKRFVQTNRDGEIDPNGNHGWVLHPEDKPIHAGDKGFRVERRKTKLSLVSKAA